MDTRSAVGGFLTKSNETWANMIHRAKSSGQVEPRSLPGPGTSAKWGDSMKAFLPSMRSSTYAGACVPGGRKSYSFRNRECSTLEALTEITWPIYWRINYIDTDS